MYQFTAAICVLCIFTCVQGQRSVDMALIVDAGEHMLKNKQLWDETKTFLNNLLLERLPISRTHYKVSLMTYGNSINTEWTFSNAQSSTKFRTIKKKIKDLTPTGGEISKMADVINAAGRLFKGRKNDRPKSPNVVLIFHNRYSCNTSFEGVASAVASLEKKTAIFVVTEKMESVDFDELVSLNTVPDFIFRFKDYRQILAALSFHVENNVV